jgi:hypothetical protein
MDDEQGPHPLRHGFGDYGYLDFTFTLFGHLKDTSWSRLRGHAPTIWVVYQRSDEEMWSSRQSAAPTCLLRVLFRSLELQLTVNEAYCVRIV